MYDPKFDRTPDALRFPLPDETVFAHVRRVVDEWKQNKDGVVFGSAPARLRAEFPEVFGRIDDDRLGTLCALAWLYLGANAVNDRVLHKWFVDAVRS